MPITSPDANAESSPDDRKRCGFLPLAVDVSGRLCVVVGCGRVAKRKVLKLLEHGARVRLVVPAFESIAEAEDDWPFSRLEVVVLDDCQAEELAGARLVIAATNDTEVNRRVARIAREMGILALQVDAPDESDFHVPATLKAGDLTVAFSTNGASPPFAARLRDQAKAVYGPAHAEFCQLARWLRREAMTSVLPEARELLFQRLVESDALELLARGERATAKAVAGHLLDEARANAAAGVANPRDSGDCVDKAPTVGKVYLVGAGPGDPGLLTVKGERCLKMADTVLFDGMVNPLLFDICPSNAKRLNVGKRKGKHERTQEEINTTLIREARLGRTVVRLKGGDPLVFGRGGEEARALRQAGVAFEIVPGVSSVTAVPAYAGIPVTDREYSSSFAVYSAHRKGGLCFSDAEWRCIAQGPETLVFLMGKTRCDLIVRKLREFGRPASTPVAIIFNGTTPQQRTVVGTLGSIVSQTEEMDIPGPGLIIVGEVVNIMPAMTWFKHTVTAQYFGEIETHPVDRSSSEANANVVE